MKTVELKGREIPLLYTTWEMKQIQEEIAPLDRTMGIILGREPDGGENLSMFGSADHLKAVAKLVRILGNAGLEEAGENADLTDKKVLRSIRPAELSEVINKCLEAMQEGMASEIPDDEEKGPVDVTLEEIERKKEPTS